MKQIVLQIIKQLLKIKEIKITQSKMTPNLLTQVISNQMILALIILRITIQNHMNHHPPTNFFVEKMISNVWRTLLCANQLAI